MHLMTAIEYESSCTKGGDMSELTNPDRMRKNVSRKEHMKNTTHFPIRIVANGAANQEGVEDVCKIVEGGKIYWHAN